MSKLETITFRINGTPHAVEADASETLLDVLREKLNLTGSKRGCNQGVCGACTVMSNGVPVRSCLLLAHECEGVEITTIEGLALGDKLSPVQEAFVTTSAPQCGFCMSGMVVAATALLRTNPAATRQEMREALSGNLCRCTGYVKVEEAIDLVREEAK